jgi:hypothetical protein
LARADIEASPPESRMARIERAGRIVPPGRQVMLARA